MDMFVTWIGALERQLTAGGELGLGASDWIELNYI